MVKQRRRVKHTATFEERLAEEAINLKRPPRKNPPGALPRNCSCGAPDFQKLHYTSTSGFDLPGYSRPRH